VRDNGPAYACLAKALTGLAAMEALTVAVSGPGSGCPPSGAGDGYACAAWGGASGTAPCCTVWRALENVHLQPYGLTANFSDAHADAGWVAGVVAWTLGALEGNASAGQALELSAIFASPYLVENWDPAVEQDKQRQEQKTNQTQIHTNTGYPIPRGWHRALSSQVVAGRGTALAVANGTTTEWVLVAPLAIAPSLLPPTASHLRVRARAGGLQAVVELALRDFVQLPAPIVLDSGIFAHGGGAGFGVGGDGYPGGGYGGWRLRGRPSNR